MVDSITMFGCSPRHNDIARQIKEHLAGFEPATFSLATSYSTKLNYKCVIGAGSVVTVLHKSPSSTPLFVDRILRLRRVAYGQRLVDRNRTGTICLEGRNANR